MRSVSLRFEHDGNSHAALAQVFNVEGAAVQLDNLARDGQAQAGAHAGRLRGEKRIENPGQVFFLRSEEHTSELQSHLNLVCRLLLEKKKKALRTVAAPQVRPQ